MDWNDRLGLLSDEEVEGYLHAMCEEADRRRRKDEKTEALFANEPPFPPIDPED